MSFISAIARAVTRSLKLGSRPTEPDYQPNERVKLRHTNITNLQDPRFTKDQWDQLMSKAVSAKASSQVGAWFDGDSGIAFCSATLGKPGRKMEIVG